MFDLMVSYANSVNLFITNLCNSACPYCCVRDWITHDSETAQYMSFRDLGRVIEVLKRSGIDSVRLLGGEPMLHPEIGGFVDRSIVVQPYWTSLFTTVGLSGILATSAMALSRMRKKR